MRLSDIMGHANLALFPEIALCIFLAVFVGVIFYTFRPRHHSLFEKTKLLPLDEQHIESARYGK